jgi:hypothetical protein
LAWLLTGWRDVILIELKPEYANMIERRIRGDAAMRECLRR